MNYVEQQRMLLLSLGKKMREKSEEKRFLASGIDSI